MAVSTPRVDEAFPPISRFFRISAEPLTSSWVIGDEVFTPTSPLEVIVSLSLSGVDLLRARFYFQLNY